MNHREAVFRAAVAAATALGLDIASGRALAAFYAQTGWASWLGILFSAVCFGAAVGWICRLARKMGADSLRVLLRRLGCGRMASALHGLALLAGICMAAAEAGHMGSLMLPLHRADVFAALIAMALALAAALSGRGAMQGLGAAFLICLGAYMAVLLCFAELPQQRPNYSLELKLENNIPAALTLALLHTAAAVSLSAGAAVRQGCAGVQPGRLGVCAGGLYGIALALGNGILQGRQGILMRLQLPFAALSCGWGRAGFYAGGAMIYMGYIAALAGIFYGSIPKRKSRILIEKDVKF